MKLLFDVVFVLRKVINRFKWWEFIGIFEVFKGDIVLKEFYWFCVWFI